MKRIQTQTDAKSGLSYRPVVPLWFFYQEKTYEAGGVASLWKQYTEGDLTAFWADWRGSYGVQSIQLLSLGVSDACTVKMSYIPGLYDLLRTRDVTVIKGANPAALKDGAPDPAHPDTYRLYGGVDDIRSMRRVMEFKVRRYEAK